MTTNRHERVFARRLPEIIEEAIAVLRQDLPEYMLIGLVGAFAACMAVIIPALIGGPVALALIAPMFVIIAVGTLATSAAALEVGANQMQPDAARAFTAAGLRSIAVLRPWLPLVVALGAASFAAAALAPHLGPVPPEAIILSLVLASGAYALPRCLYATALFERDLSAREALSVSAGLVRRATRTFAAAWCLVLAPAMIAAALGALSGFNTATGAVVAVLFVGAMPAGAAIMSQLFIDAAAPIETALTLATQAKRGKPARIAQRRG